jgi:prepilin-type processing-associated H-X9-DG protein
MNGAYGSGPDNTTPPRSSTLYLVRLASVQAPATTVWATDNNNAPSASNPGGSQGFFWGTLPAINTSATPHQLQNIVARHFDFTDVLFCDGHVKAMKLEVLRRSNEAGSPRRLQSRMTKHTSSPQTIFASRTHLEYSLTGQSPATC